MNEPGYDSATELLLLADNADEWPLIPLNPTKEMVQDALARLWEPVSTFPYVEPIDRGVMLSAMLTACVRSILPTAPGYVVTAHSAGTGKTKLGQSLAALTSSAPAVAPWSHNKEEQRKTLMAALLSGPSVLLIDNLTGSLDSAELCAILTSETYEDRRLGASERVSAPTSVLLVVTGNNASVVGDLSRRLLPIRLDHGVERPDRLVFDFDPVERIRERWVAMRCDALTVLRGFLSAGAPRNGEGAFGSFETWEHLIRQCVVWLQVTGIAAAAGVGPIADPGDAVARNFEEDPETCKLRALMTAWNDAFSDKPTTVAAVVDAAQDAYRGFGEALPDQALYEAIDEIAGERGGINSRRLGKWLESISGRMMNGRRFERDGIYSGRVRWALRECV